MSEPLNQPRCPECKIVGNEYIDCIPSEKQNRLGDPWFETAFCVNCGHVYGVFAKVVYKPSPAPLPPF
jgi:SAM-dependent MidA family methyltransferase